MSFLGNFESYSNTKYDKYLKDISDTRWKTLKKAEVVPFLKIGNSKLLKSTMNNIETRPIGTNMIIKR